MLRKWKFSALSHPVMPCLVLGDDHHAKAKQNLKSLASYNLDGNSLSTFVYSFVTVCHNSDECLFLHILLCWGYPIIPRGKLWQLLLYGREVIDFLQSHWFCHSWKLFPGNFLSEWFIFSKRLLYPCSCILDLLWLYHLISHMAPLCSCCLAAWWVISLYWKRNEMKYF